MITKTFYYNLGTDEILEEGSTYRTYLTSPDHYWMSELVNSPNGDELFNTKTGTPKKAALDFLKIMHFELEGTNYIYYTKGNFIAEWNPMRRLIVLYPKSYFISRMLGMKSKETTKIRIAKLNDKGEITGEYMINRGTSKLMKVKEDM